MTKETIIRALKRAGWAMLMGAGAAFVAVPVNLKKPKAYLSILVFSLLTGAFMGLKKFISGYVKYDRPKK